MNKSVKGMKLKDVNRVCIRWISLKYTYILNNLAELFETRKLVNARMRCNSITKDYISHWNVTTKGFTAFNFVGF